MLIGNNVSYLILFAVSKFEIRKLRKELKEQAIVLESTRLIAIRDKLQEQLEQSSISKEEKKAIQDQIKPFQRQIYDVRSLPDEILMNVSPTSFDWIKLSIQSVRPLAFRHLFYSFTIFIIIFFNRRISVFSITYS